MAAKRTAKQQPRLTPGAIAEELFCLDPDRDERAPAAVRRDPAYPGPERLPGT